MNYIIYVISYMYFTEKQTDRVTCRESVIKKRIHIPIHNPSPPPPPPPPPAQTFLPPGL